MIYTTEIKNEILKRLDKHFIFTNNLLKDRITGTIQKSNETIKDYLLRVEEYRTKMKETLIKYNEKNTKTDEVLFDLNEDVEKEVFSYNFDDTNKKTILEELNDADTANGSSIVQTQSITEEENKPPTWNWKLTDEERKKLDDEWNSLTEEEKEERKKQLEEEKEERKKEKNPFHEGGWTGSNPSGSGGKNPKKLGDVAEFIGNLVDTFIDLIKIIIKMTKMGLKFGQFLIAIIPIFLIIFVVISIDNDLEFL